MSNRKNIPEVIILHHSLTSDGVFLEDAKAIKRYHVETLGWSDIGYHWILESVDGKLVWVKGRDESTRGAHTYEQGMNYRSIGICVVGNFDEDYLTDEHMVMIKSKVLEIRERYQMDMPVKGHRAYATYKSCPGLIKNDKKMVDVPVEWFISLVRKIVEKD